MICKRCGKIYDKDEWNLQWMHFGELVDVGGGPVCKSCYKDFLAYWRRGNALEETDKSKKDL